MKRILVSTTIVVAAVVLASIAVGSAGGASSDPTYKIELDNAFGLVSGAELKVAGVRAGSIGSIDLDQRTLHAVVTVHVTQGGFGSFRTDAFCQSRPQSLIGEYFIDCDPGHATTALKSGSTIPVTQTESTIPADLVLNIMRMPYRERLSLIINELGAAAAARSGDIQAALQRAVPALTETDNLLALLANDSQTLQQLTVSSDALVTALANNRAQVQRFITEANNTATATATQQANLQSTLHQLPGFLEQLRPAMAQLGAAASANEPVLANLNASSAQLDQLLTALPSFSKSAIPAIKSLGQASVTGKAAVEAAGPTVSNLDRFAEPTPELAQNLAIVLGDLDNRSRAVEPDKRSPEGKGYTGLEALLQYVFNQTLAINAYGPLGHVLAVDGFVDSMCSPYASPATIVSNLQNYGARYRECYSWLGPNQPGINEPDPTNPGACVPDPGGAPPGEKGPKTNACKLTEAEAVAEDQAAVSSQPGATATPSASAASDATGGTRPSAVAASSDATKPSSSQASSGSQAAQLLDYLLSP